MVCLVFYFFIFYIITFIAMLCFMTKERNNVIVTPFLNPAEEESI